MKAADTAADRVGAGLALDCMGTPPSAPIPLFGSPMLIAGGGKGVAMAMVVGLSGSNCFKSETHERWVWLRPENKGRGVWGVMRNQGSTSG